jgi:SanA protein
MKIKKSYIKKFLLSIAILIYLLINIVVIANWIIEDYSSKFVFNKIGLLPTNRVGLVLGTSKNVGGGKKNPYFYYRIQAAAELYFAGKIKYIVASGDNSDTYYNEPREMKNALIKMGIPASKVFEDYAGFRTLDAIIRCREIFGQNKFTIISQEFHNKRAIFIARKNGIETVGYNAKDVDAQTGFKTNLRELFARIAVFLDLFIIHTEPKFLGEKVVIKNQTLQEQLENYLDKWRKDNTQERNHIFEEAINNIGRSGILESALNIGDTIPDFELVDSFSSRINLSFLLEQGPVVIIWFRGGWCPYSSLQLQDWQESLTQLYKLRASLIAISPEKPTISLNTVEENHLGYPVLSDNGNKLARKFGLVYSLPINLQKEYSRVIDWYENYGDHSYKLPMTATYIIGCDKVIYYACIDADYRHRGEPADIIEELKKLKL